MSTSPTRLISWLPMTRIFRPGALRRRLSRVPHKAWIVTSPRQMIASLGVTVRCQLRKRASSISCELTNGRAGEGADGRGMPEVQVGPDPDAPGVRLLEFASGHSARDVQHAASRPAVDVGVDRRLQVLFQLRLVERLQRRRVHVVEADRPDSPRIGAADRPLSSKLLASSGYPGRLRGSERPGSRSLDVLLCRRWLLNPPRARSCCT